MFRPTRVVLHSEVVPQYDRLERRANDGSQPEQAIWNTFQTALERVKRDGQWGEVIPKSRIPSFFVARYGAKNLYCVDLAAFWRCFYTIVGRDVVFLDVVDHRDYDRLFGKR